MLRDNDVRFYWSRRLHCEDFGSDITCDWPTWAVDLTLESRQVAKVVLGGQDWNCQPGLMLKLLENLFRVTVHKRSLHQHVWQRYRMMTGFCLRLVASLVASLGHRLLGHSAIARQYAGYTRCITLLRNIEAIRLPAFWRLWEIVIQEFKGIPETFRDQRLPAFEKYLQCPSPLTEQCLTECEEDLLLVAEDISSRTIFATEPGHLGRSYHLAPDRSLPGDLFVGLFGVDFPSYYVRLETASTE
ncbi:hypothetical protein BU25DRAFT_170526 [Macroventuria anomochaeta]|uniref:Uncharacterized protein n=1 Tax=Macroventuria anomochaeta TaxID=301207 RepID=A0ACB6RQE0_9PLEO|nr:uncharacterized protein BU25DRAFT_170526 [Macroventuria anomochaeta]KAF2623927.1 hypothetical protein BU25DRAFT_170526 [Macroventuria anomochaeta]